MRFTAISGLVFAALLQVGQQPGVTSPSSGVATSVSSAAFPLLAPNGSFGASSYAFAASPSTGLYSNGLADIVVASNGTNVAQFRDLAGAPRITMQGTRGMVYAPGGYAGVNTKALTESVATTFAQHSLGLNANVGGTLEFCVFARDASNVQNRCAKINYSLAETSGGAVTCAFAPTAPDETNDGNAAAISAGTLTYFITTTSAANACNFLANATSSLTQTTLQIEYRFSAATAGYSMTPQ